MEEKVLGKITVAKFGLGGYQDAMIGLHVCFEFGGSGVCDTKSYWDSNVIECSDHCKWTEEDRSAAYADIMRFVSDTLSAAKVSEVSQLVGKPVEVTMKGNTLESWRVLTEVL